MSNNLTENANVAKLVEFDETMDRESPAVRALALETMENGGVLYLPKGGFSLTPREREIVLDASVTLPTRRERKSDNGRPTVVFDPNIGKILRSRIRSPEREELESAMARYSEWAENLVKQLLPSYAGNLVRDRITFRPCERTKRQGLHVDSSYGRPTEGRGMIRVFCNINPNGRPRVWQIGEDFEIFAQRYLDSVHIRNTNPVQRLLANLGITKGKRTAYDNLLADIRGKAKHDKDFQANSPRRIFEFPVGSAWIAITDLALHGAISGQYSLDQTFFLPIETMSEPENSSLRILERLTGEALV